jgi:hypothetical protein
MVNVHSGIGSDLLPVPLQPCPPTLRTPSPSRPQSQRSHPQLRSTRSNTQYMVRVCARRQRPLVNTLDAALHSLSLSLLMLRPTSVRTSCSASSPTSPCPLVEAAKKQQADLLVLGTRGMSAMKSPDVSSYQSLVKAVPTHTLTEWHSPHLFPLRSAPCSSSTQERASSKAQWRPHPQRRRRQRRCSCALTTLRLPSARCSGSSTGACVRVCVHVRAPFRAWGGWCCVRACVRACVPHSHPPSYPRRLVMPGDQPPSVAAMEKRMSAEDGRAVEVETVAVVQRSMEQAQAHGVLPHHLTSAVLRPSKAPCRTSAWHCAATRTTRGSTSRWSGRTVRERERERPPGKI